MSWFFYALGAIGAEAFSDLFRKFGSVLKDPFLTNLIFQAGAFITAIVLYMLFSRKSIPHTNAVTSLIIGGILISIFAAFFFKSLSIGPGVSVVSPIIRAGGVVLIAILGILFLHEKISLQLVSGIILACVGIYLIFLNQ